MADQKQKKRKTGKQIEDKTEKIVLEEQQTEKINTEDIRKTEKKGKKRAENRKKEKEERKKAKNSVSLRWYKKRQGVNIGILIFALVFIYLVVTVIMYATSKRISVYEVKEGSIVRNNFYTGLILRKETVVKAEASGYVSYFRGEGDKVSSGGNIYAISPEQIHTESQSDTEDAVLNTEVQKNLILRIQSFDQNYDPQRFSAVYALKNEISAALEDASDQTKTVRLDAAAAQEGSNITAIPSVRDGIVGLTIDGYEDKTGAQLDVSDFDRNSYQPLRLEDQIQVEAGDPVYKLITSENWDIYIQLDAETADVLSETSSVKTKIGTDKENLWADFSVIKKDGRYYGCLTYDNSMVRYAGERFVNVELILEDESGLKIPKSAVVKRQFYVIPSSYLVSGGNNSSLGVMVQGEDGGASYQEVTSYFPSALDYLIYISPQGFSDGMILIRPESSQTYRMKNKKELTGVYNINRGYAVFNQINILCKNDDYYIVEDHMEYGPSNYDHIIQDGSSVEEGEVVFQ